MEEIKEKLEEISAFIGLLVIELNQYVYQYCIEDDYIDQEVRSDIYQITRNLRNIQNELNKQTPDKITELLQELEKLKQKQYYQDQQSHPTGYAFIIKSVCKKAIRKISDENVKNYLSIVVDYFDNLGKYLNDTYYYKMK